MLDAPAVFLSEEEIVADMLLYRLTESEKLAFRRVPVTDLKDVCLELSSALIQHYRLSDENNPYTVHDAMHPNYPSKVSYRIVAKVWARLTGNTIPNTEALVHTGWWAG